MMRIDWRGFQSRHATLFSALVTMKRLRTKAAVACVLACLAEQVYFHEAPFDLGHLTVWTALALVAIGVGTIFRLAALGSIRKKRQLATSGAYALCRHPLYLGSILIAVGFCALLRNAFTWIIAASYFTLFYPLTIAWEEERLEERYGEQYRTYRDSVPLLVPTGSVRWNRAAARRAMSRGGLVLLVCELILLGVIEAMAKTL